MVRAYVLVDTDVGSSPDLIESIREMEGVRTAHVIAGDWDVMVVFDVSEVYQVLSTTTTAIQELDGVLDTKTYVALDE
ncbi:Lrp/AsnC ligand binding domain-containing protein [Halopenitus persicus]|uniref:Transcriptional regulator, AsnC family n=1 Tax=Halopenitus persicus TaxID=1048396 RepID=A0A1H3KI90_9EURY|nr:Lrp/AsnC ligand binding domain-containing protein [Halopenitus persicus]QHS17839.1 Lrp/AsnC family transcriptional regulator [haloarchaeon 3A1-DGR]SDY51867.1 transcriptional regulator, AsnC family [Halopenitus persicus]